MWLLAVSAVGCVSHDLGEEPQAGDRLVAFPTPLVSAVTKASETAYPKDRSFGVFGLYCPDGDFAGWDKTQGSVLYIDGAEFKFSGSVDDSTEGSGAWISSPAYFWPNNGKMTFAAWSPYSVKADYGENFGYGANGLSVSGFSTGGKGKCDLMYSARVHGKTSSAGGSNPTYDGIDIVFHHALSALRFGASASSEGVTVAIARVTLWGFARQGDFSENVAEDYPTVYASYPSWDGLADYYTKSDSLVVSGPDLETFVIPQKGADGAKMKVYYTVKVGSGNPVPAVSKDIPLFGHTVSGSDDTIDGWRMATRYNYNLVLTDQHQIRFSVNVTNWSDCGEGDSGFTIND